jgi:cytochrome c peroxidase
VPHTFDRVSGIVNSSLMKNASEMKFGKPLFRHGLGAVTMLFLIACGNPGNERKSKQEKVTETISDLGALPMKPEHPAGNPPNPDKVALGRLLFFDPVLSGNKDVACATCHQPEFNYAEFLETSIGVNGSGTGSKRQFVSPNDIPFVKRNSQSVLNAAFNGLLKGTPYHPESAPMFWDMRAKGLEEQALMPIRTFEEMRGHGYPEENVIDAIIERIRQIPAYKVLFEKAFKGESDPVTAVNLGKALASYERTLIATNSRFDQYMRGDSNALTTGEKEGMNLFLKTGCAKCHSGPMLSDFKVHVLGVPESQNRAESDSGMNNTYAFRTPTLRNLRFTAPYMHSGKFNTLEQVLQFYEDAAGGKIQNPNVKIHQIDTLITGMNVNFRDISRIVEFLNAINDDSFDKTIPPTVPSGLRVLGR